MSENPRFIMIGGFLGAGKTTTISRLARHFQLQGKHVAIVTNDQAAADRFMAAVDSAIVLHNASTQFADGGELGMGAALGIATGKLHARGPVGAEQLTSFKYLVEGDGAARA